jgi:hypothetical protein
MDYNEHLEGYIPGVYEKQEEESEEIRQAREDLKHKGRELRTIMGTQAWDIVMSTIQSYVTQANDDLMEMLPGDTRVPAAHAAVSALHQFVKNFKEDIENAVNQSFD